MIHLLEKERLRLKGCLKHCGAICDEPIDRRLLRGHLGVGVDAIRNVEVLVRLVAERPLKSLCFNVAWLELRVSGCARTTGEDVVKMSAMTDQALNAPIMPRVLVVEDEFLIRMLVADHLRAEGFTVVEALNGDEAIAILTAGALVDLVFTDVRMPGAADGMALLEFVKRTQPELPVLMTSGHLEPQLAYAGGAAQFLPKPCDPEAVIDAIRAALRSRS